PVSRPRSLPVDRKAQEVECGRTFGTPMFTSRSLDGHQARLVRVQLQAETLETFTEHRHDSTRILFVLEAQHEIVRITHDLDAPFQTRSHHFFDPLIEDVVQVNVAQDGREHRPLHRSLARFVVRLPVEYTDVQTFTDQSQQRLIGYPQPQHLLQL